MTLPPTISTPRALSSLVASLAMQSGYALRMQEEVDPLQVELLTCPNTVIPGGLARVGNRLPLDILHTPTWLGEMERRIADCLTTRLRRAIQACVRVLSAPGPYSDGEDTASCGLCRAGQ